MKTEVTLLREEHEWTKRYKLQHGKFIATFEVNQDGDMTFFDAINSQNAKDYHFELSKPGTVKMIAMLLRQAADIATKAKREGKK